MKRLAMACYLTTAVAIGGLVVVVNHEAMAEFPIVTNTLIAAIIGLPILGVVLEHMGHE